MGSTQFIFLRNCGHGRFYQIALGVAYFNLAELRRPRGPPSVSHRLIYWNPVQLQ